MLAAKLLEDDLPMSGGAVDVGTVIDLIANRVGFKVGCYEFAQ